MRDLPNWIKKVLDNDDLTCGACNKIVSLKDLFSVGIQKGSKKPHKEVLAIGLICEFCKEMTIFELNDMTLLDLAFEILEEQSKTHDNKNRKDLDKEMGIEDDKNVKNDKNDKKFKRTKSKITSKEIKKTVTFLNELKTHDDFLLALGMSWEEIDSYKIKKRDRKID